MKKIILSIIFFLQLFVLYTPVLAQVSTDEADSVLQKVREKVEALKQNPKAIIGTITDKTDTSLQIKETNDKIGLVSISDLTKYTKLDKTESDIKFTDIAIGDFVSALGTFGNAKVLNAKRVLLLKTDDSDRIIAAGKIVSIVKKQIIISTEDKESSFSFPARWKGPEIKELSIGDNVIIVSIASNGKDEIRTIQILGQTK